MFSTEQVDYGLIERAVFRFRDLPPYFDNSGNGSCLSLVCANAINLLQKEQLISGQEVLNHMTFPWGTRSCLSLLPKGVSRAIEGKTTARYELAEENIHALLKAGPDYPIVALVNTRRWKAALGGYGAVRGILPSNHAILVYGQEMHLTGRRLLIFDRNYDKGISIYEDILTNARPSAYLSIIRG